MLKIQMTIIVFSLFLLFVIIELIRRGRLKENYSLLWLLTAFTMLLIGIFPNILNFVSKITGMFYLSCIFLIAFVFLLLIVLHYSILISNLSKQNKKLAQSLALLENKLNQAVQYSDIER